MSDVTDLSMWNRPGQALSERQRQVHGLLRRGMSNKQIGRELGIAENTVKIHVSALLLRLGVANRLQAALRAIA